MIFGQTAAQNLSDGGLDCALSANWEMENMKNACQTTFKREIRFTRAISCLAGNWTQAEVQALSFIAVIFTPIDGDSTVKPG